MHSWKTDSLRLPFTTEKAEPKSDTLWHPEDALHQVVVFKLTLLVFVLGGLVVADATLTISLSKMFPSLTRH